MSATIITPTSERESYLRFLYKLILAQVYDKEWEWLIYDSSFRPSPFFHKLKDSRVHYFYDEENLTIGEKRNFLKSRAKGDFIAHFDDDDYYSPRYLQTINASLQTTDFFKLSSFFCYDAKTLEYFYWDTSFFRPTHFHISPLSGKKIREIDFSSSLSFSKLKEKTKKGYGFSYAYTKKVSEQIEFKKVNLDEDYAFLKKAERRGFSIDFHEDKTGLAIHIIHDMNTSSIWPQFRLPPFVVNQYFPPSLLKKYPR